MTSSPPAGNSLRGATPGGCSFYAYYCLLRWPEPLSSSKDSLGSVSSCCRFSIWLPQLRRAEACGSTLRKRSQKGIEPDQILHWSSFAKGRRILAWLLVKQTEIPGKPRYQRLQGTNQSGRPGKGRRRKYCSRSYRTYLRPIIRSRHPRKPRLGFRTSCRTRQENCKGTKTLPSVRVCLPISIGEGLP